MLRLFAKRGMSTEAEALLNKIDELIVEGTMKTGGPDIFYEAVLEALGRCGMGNEAERLIQQMKDQNLNPNLIHYTAAINAWAKHRQRRNRPSRESL